MDIAASWLTPLHFTRLGIGHEEKPRFLFTYGPFSDDLLRAAETGLFTDPTRLARSVLLTYIGPEWLASFMREESQLWAFLQTDVGIRRPGQPAAFLGLRSPTPMISHELLERFCASAGREIESFCVDELRWLVAPLREAAERNERPNATAAIKERLLEVLGPLEGATLTPAVSGNRPVMTVEFPDLRQWVLYELLDVYETQPSVRRCRLCSRLFIPVGRETQCRRFLWGWPTRSSARPVRGCVRREQHDRDIHRREYKRKHVRLTRLAKAHGRDHPLVVQARDEFRAWQSEHGFQRGPQPRAVPPVVRPRR